MAKRRITIAEADISGEGRPPKGEEAPPRKRFLVSLEEDMIAKLDQMAKDAHASRSGVVRWLIFQGIECIENGDIEVA